jgi:hypothetical protein
MRGVESSVDANGHRYGGRNSARLACCCLKEGRKNGGERARLAQKGAIAVKRSGRKADQRTLLES